jgi:hypothetical protein
MESLQRMTYFIARGLLSYICWHGHQQTTRSACATGTNTASHRTRHKGLREAAATAAGIPLPTLVQSSADRQWPAIPNELSITWDGSLSSRYPLPVAGAQQRAWTSSEEKKRVAGVGKGRGELLYWTVGGMLQCDAGIRMAAACDSGQGRRQRLGQGV